MFATILLEFDLISHTGTLILHSSGLNYVFNPTKKQTQRFHGHILWNCAYIIKRICFAWKGCSI